MKYLFDDLFRNAKKNSYFQIKWLYNIIGWRFLAYCVYRAYILQRRYTSVWQNIVYIWNIWHNFPEWSRACTSVCAPILRVSPRKSPWCSASHFKIAYHIAPGISLPPLYHIEFPGGTLHTSRYIWTRYVSAIDSISRLNGAAFACAFRTRLSYIGKCTQYPPRLSNLHKLSTRYETTNFANLQYAVIGIHTLHHTTILWII